MTMNTMTERHQPTAKINIWEHYKALDEKQKAVAAKRNAEVTTVKEEITTLERELAGHAEEIKKKQKCRSGMEEIGLCTTECDNQIASLDSLKMKTQAKVNVLRQQVELQQDTPVDKLKLATELVRHLRERHKCEEAIRVAQTDDCWQHLPVKLRLNEQGNPVECIVGLGANTHRTVKIRPGVVRYLKGFRPESVRWLPSTEESLNVVEQESDGQSADAIHVFVDDEGNVLISAVKCIVEEQKERAVKDRYGSESVESHWVKWEVDMNLLTTSLESCFDERAARVQGELDLNEPYADNGMMKHLRDFVMSHTIPEPPFERTDVELTSPEIYKLIIAHWDELARCPWSNSIKHTPALLKHCVENGEKARFWVQDYKNHYGFRLRTRDHSWIGGRIYIAPSTGKVTEKKGMQVGGTKWGNRNQWLLTLGDMRLLVFEGAVT